MKKTVKYLAVNRSNGIGLVIDCNFKIHEARGDNFNYIADGKSLDDVVGLNLDDLYLYISSGIIHDAKSCIDLAIRTGEEQWFEYEMRTTKGKRYFLASIGVCEELFDGKPAVDWYAFDITKTKQKVEDENTRHKQALVTDLIAGFTHEHNSIHTAIIGYTELAKMLTKDETLITYLNGVLEASKKAKSSIDRLSAYTNKQSIVIEDFDLKEIVDREIKIISKNREIECRRLFEKSSYLVTGNIFEISSMVRELLNHSSESICHIGYIDLIVENYIISETDNFGEKGDKYVKLSIRDYGEGISKSMQPNMFFPALNKKDGALKLGLYNVKNIVDKHKGHIRYYRREDEHSTFMVYLKAALK